MFTPNDFDKMTTDPRWAGHGYLGERRSFISKMEHGERGDLPQILQAADAMVLNVATARGMTWEQLFKWANSKDGRHYGDCWFGADGQDSEYYLPR